MMREYLGVGGEWVVIGGDGVLGGVSDVSQQNVGRQGGPDAQGVIGNRLAPHLQRCIILHLFKTCLQLIN